MQKITGFFKQICGWAAAFLIAFAICDAACFLFYDPCQELVRQHGSTTGYLLPSSHGVYGLEGYCVANMDDCGYVNRNMPRADEYYVVAGASHTEGLFIPEDKRYSDLLNDALYDDGKLHVINIGKSGNYFSVVLQHLDGILGEFPDAKGIIIETDSLCYDTKALYDSMTQAGYDPMRLRHRLSKRCQSGSGLPSVPSRHCRFCVLYTSSIIRIWNPSGNTKNPTYLIPSSGRENSRVILKLRSMI